MSHSARTAPIPPAPEQEIVLPEVHVVDRKAAVVFTGPDGRPGDHRAVRARRTATPSFRLAAPDDFVELPTVTVPSTATAWILIVICALCADWPHGG